MDDSTSDKQPDLIENPFAVSALDRTVDSLDFAHAGDPTQFTIQNGLVQCGPLLHLPPICLFSGSTEDLIPVTVRSNRPSMKLVLYDQTCLITYYQTRAIRQRMRAKTRTRLLLMPIFVTAIIYFPENWVGNGWLNGLFFGFLIVATIGLLIRIMAGNSPRLILVKYRNPDLYWLKGFTTEQLTWFVEAGQTNSKTVL